VPNTLIPAGGPCLGRISGPGVALNSLADNLFYPENRPRKSGRLRAHPTFRKADDYCLARELHAVRREVHASDRKRRLAPAGFRPRPLPPNRESPLLTIIRFCWLPPFGRFSPGVYLRVYHRMNVAAVLLPTHRAVAERQIAPGDHRCLEGSPGRAEGTAAKGPLARSVTPMDSGSGSGPAAFGRGLS
jgi:hypothetical protein